MASSGDTCCGTWFRLWPTGILYVRERRKYDISFDEMLSFYDVFIGNRFVNFEKFQRKPVGSMVSKLYVWKKFHRHSSAIILSSKVTYE